LKPSTKPIFWRDAALPFVELLQVLDGRDVSYAPHSHEEWSIGAILDGQSEFLCADRLHTVQCGALVMMNPDVVHACNPSQDSPWAYYMMHVDKHWLALLLHQMNIRHVMHWQDSAQDTLVNKVFYYGFLRVCQSVMSPTLSADKKEVLLKAYFVDLFSNLDGSAESSDTNLPTNKLYQVADYLYHHCLEETSIDIVSESFGFSTGYLVRAFKRHFNMTPHAYRLNRRIQLGQQALKEGQTIADIAHTIGFSDQAHFQRVFKKRVAATPDQYRRVLTLQN